jgi:DNA-binding XRE family transcriptional regulator
MASPIGNKIVSQNRGKAWKAKLVAGKLDSQLNPTALKLRRVNKAISQDALAELIGVSLSTYGGIERGKRTVRPETAKQLAEALSASVTQLFQKGDAGKLVASRVKSL